MDTVCKKGESCTLVLRDIKSGKALKQASVTLLRMNGITTGEFKCKHFGNPCTVREGVH